MRYRIGVSIALAIWLAVGTAWAHHSTGALYMAEAITVTGTLTKIDWRNPHIRVFVDVRGEQGQVESWALEGGAPIWYKTHADFDKAKFGQFLGQTVTVMMCPALKGPGRALLHTMTFPDGTTLRSLGTGPFGFTGDPVNPGVIDGRCR